MILLLNRLNLPRMASGNHAKTSHHFSLSARLKLNHTPNRTDTTLYQHPLTRPLRGTKQSQLYRANCKVYNLHIRSASIEIASSYLLATSGRVVAKSSKHYKVSLSLSARPNQYPTPQTGRTTHHPK